MYHLAEAYLMAAFIVLLAAYCGVLGAGAACRAPVVTKCLEAAVADQFLINFWLYFHRFAVAGGLIFTATMTLAASYSAIPIRYSAFCVALGALLTSCFYVGLSLVSKINTAMREQRSGSAARLRRADTVLIVCGLIVGVWLLAALIYVLPGQFTFWPAASL